MSAKRKFEFELDNIKAKNNIFIKNNTSLRDGNKNSETFSEIQVKT